MKLSKQSILIVTILCMSLTSCVRRTSKELGKDDLADFSPAWSEYGVTRSIVPEKFVDKFAYIDGYCCHFCYTKSYFSLFNDSDRALLYFKYDDETYYLAKEYVFENLELSYKSVEKYNGYIFYDNYTGDSLEFNFPYSFMRFAYNDSINSLIFIGAYTSLNFDENLPELSNNWGDFLEEYYGNWYDFSQ